MFAELEYTPHEYDGFCIRKSTAGLDGTGRSVCINNLPPLKSLKSVNKYMRLIREQLEDAGFVVRSIDIANVLFCVSYVNKDKQLVAFYIEPHLTGIGSHGNDLKLLSDVIYQHVWTLQALYRRTNKNVNGEHDAG